MGAGTLTQSFQFTGGCNDSGGSDRTVGREGESKGGAVFFFQFGISRALEALLQFEISTKSTGGAAAVQPFM